jgi:hypothetical protein
MTRNHSNGEQEKKDYFLTTLEEGSLTMEPYCACGEYLNEDYFCESCQRQCTCIEFRCDSDEAQKEIQKLIENNPRFHNFTASLVGP